MTIRVVPTEFATIQDAIDAAVAGDSIQILAGTFDGFNVNKERLKIFGCGIGKTIIAGNPSPDSGTNGIDVNANQTTLQGFTVQGFNENGVLVNSNFVIMTEIESKFNMRDGIGLISNLNNLLINIVASNNRRSGFNCLGGFGNGKHCLINFLSTQNHSIGFRVTELDNNKIINSTSNKNLLHGIDFQNASEFNALFGNKILNNNGNGVDSGTSNNMFIENLICNNEGNGILLSSFDIANIIDSNIVRNNGNDDTTAGILVEDSAPDNIIRFNKAKNNIDLDIEAEGGIGTNIYDGNKCENSSPNGLCT
ncbi:right-handed parallel beta-helix repeat-containing protein [Bacillus solimangrovi]|uniref:Right handed beta helix domain-containing protein n=1 Tax=Bacillus solimangrovi TaxID=1305675 RepID=A0A1E5LAL0_9BACI|nr:right-handed parallel beta-helix repeat-containing protein [Bacillus solimangrovi]OEH91138.1 hypothetical protein BFG57_07135 [Bacillus solimangrovi]